jgi:hypothetical protein
LFMLLFGLYYSCSTKFQVSAVVQWGCSRTHSTTSPTSYPMCPPGHTK